MASQDAGITTSLRSDPCLLTAKENDALAPSGRRPCQFYMLQYHHDRLLAAAGGSTKGSQYPLVAGENGADDLASKLIQHLESTYGDSTLAFALKVRNVQA